MKSAIHATRASESRGHGGAATAAATGGRAGDRGPAASLLDLSTCVDAFGVLPQVADALRQVDSEFDYATYPDPEYNTERRALAEYCERPIEAVDVGPGASEIIWSLVRVFAAQYQQRGVRLRALTWEPCFSEFVYAARACDATLIEHHSADDESLDVALAQLSDRIGEQQPHVVYVCAPTSPRGQWVPAQLVRQLAERYSDVWFMVDQSYLALSTHADEAAVAFPPNAVCVRSLTKEFGTPGVRVGYALLDPSLRAELAAHRPAWSIGTHAQALLRIYPACEAALRARSAQLRSAASELACQLRQLGLDAPLHDTHYFVASHRNVPQLVPRLAELYRIVVRDCASFGLPHHFRVAAHPQQARLVDALAQLSAHCEHGRGQR